MNSHHLRSLRLYVWTIMGALIVQYALGMYVNLFITFPRNATQTQLWEFAWSQKPLALHIVLAILILLGAIVLSARALLSGNKKWMIASTLGLLGVLAAGGSGATFIASQTTAFSYSMSIAFLVSFVAYGWGLFSSKNYTSHEVVST